MPNRARRPSTTLQDHSGPTESVVEEVLGSLPLRHYQRDAIREALKRLLDRTGMHLIDMPTGSGKTVVAVALIACLLGAGYHVLWVAKRWQLLKQAADTITH